MAAIMVKICINFLEVPQDLIRAKQLLGVGIAKSKIIISKPQYLVKLQVISLRSYGKDQNTLGLESQLKMELQSLLQTIVLQEIMQERLPQTSLRYDKLIKSN